MEIIPRLFDIDFCEPIRDPIWKHILFPKEFLPLLETAPFAKLARIRQLGPAYLAYPGATHTRYAHSLGVFEMAKRTLASFVRCGMPSFVTGHGARSFLAAALVHDVGHFPYAHSLKELPLEEHEALTANAVLEAPMSEALKEAGTNPETVAAIVDHSRKTHDRETVFFRLCLSGVLDPDKLDYLTRDAFFCGVPYGVQDVDFVFQHVGVTEDGKPGIDARGIMSVESVLFSKYLMYKSVYWQRTVRSATAMIKKAVISLLADGAVLPESLYGLDDSGFRTLILALGREESALVERVFNGHVYSTILEMPFDGEKASHAALLDIDKRSRLEETVASRLSGHGRSLAPLDIILDVPESVSFETGLPVIDMGLSFRDAPTVFSEGVVRSFGRSLRVLRIFSSRDLGLGMKEIQDLSGL